MMEWRHGYLMDRMKVKESDYSTQSRRSVSEQDPSKKEVIDDNPDEASDIETETSANNANPQTQTVNDSHATQAQIPNESMAQRPFYIQMVGSFLAKRSVSILSLFEMDV